LLSSVNFLISSVVLSLFSPMKYNHIFSRVILLSAATVVVLKVL